jgi:hypothetical protein
MALFSIPVVLTAILSGIISAATVLLNSLGGTSLAG